MNQNRHIQSKSILLPGFKSWTYMVITFSVTFMSCARYYYAPNSVNIPLLSEKEAKINAQYATGAFSHGFECQSAFAITPHFGGMINTMLAGSKYDRYELNSGETRTKFIEIGAGYYTPVNTTPFVFETYAGIGTGGINNKYYNGGNSKVKFTKIFIQPTIGVKLKGFEFGISNRMSWIKQNVVSNTVSNDDSEYLNLEDISNHPESFLWEPGLVMRLGGEKFMVQLQYSASANLTNPEFQFLQEQGYFTIGFCIPIHYTTSVPLTKTGGNL